MATQTLVPSKLQESSSSTVSQRAARDGADPVEGLAPVEGPDRALDDLVPDALPLLRPDRLGVLVLDEAGDALGIAPVALVAGGGELGPGALARLLEQPVERLRGPR